MQEYRKTSAHRSQEPPFPRRDYYQMVRSQIDAENQNANVRVLWLLVGEAFFVGGFATLLNAQPNAKNALYGFEQDILFWLLPISALVAGLLALAGVLASKKRIEQLESYYAAYEERTVESDPSTEGFPPMEDGKLVYWFTVLPLLGLPSLFVLAWSVVVVCQIAWLLFD